MKASNSQNKRKKEGCGKWLTTKSKTNLCRKQQKLLFKPCVFKSVIFEPTASECKTCKMKQSTMSQFIFEKKWQTNSDGKFSTVPMVTPSVKRKDVSALSEYENLCLWRSDENDLCKTIDNLGEEVHGGKQNILEDLNTVHCKTSPVKNSLKRNFCIEEDGQNITADARFPPPKRLRNSNDRMAQGIGTHPITARRGEVQFTQWFDNEVDAFIQHDVHNEDENVLNKKHLLSLPKQCPSSCEPSASDSEKEPKLIPQFSEWFNEQIQNRDDEELAGQKINQTVKELTVNIIQPPAPDVLQHNCTFTQWFETNLENFKSPI